PINSWRWRRMEDPYKPNPPEAAERVDDSGWSPHDVQSANGPLGEREHGVFRSHFQISEAELASSAIEISLGMIDEEGWCYVNGQKAGEAHDWQSASIFDVKRFLHAGDNTVAVVIANYNGGGGVNKGAVVQFQEKPE